MFRSSNGRLSGTVGFADGSSTELGPGTLGGLDQRTIVEGSARLAFKAVQPDGTKPIVFEALEGAPCGMNALLGMRSREA